VSEPYFNEAEKLLLVADAPWIGDDRIARTGKLAVHTSILKQRMETGMAVSVAQLYGLVIPGLILTKHIFRGLNRPLFCDGSEDGDKEKLVYARRSTVDYIVVKNRTTGDLEPAKCHAPARNTFVVIVSPNKHKDEFPSIDGWIDHWNWTQEDDVLAEAPTNWVDRYQERIYTLDEQVTALRE
jgi:hypothetical protein